MNIWMANQYINLVASNRQALVLALLLFAAICVYRLITGDWLGKLIGVAVLILAVYLLTGCMADSTYLAVQQSHDNAKVSVAQVQADAEVRKAQEDRTAREYEADAKVASTRAWTGMIPVALIVIGLAAITLLVVNWQGRIWLKKVENEHEYLMARGWDRSTGIESSQYKLLLDYAQRTGREVKLINGTYYLTAEDQPPIKALLME